MLAGHAAFEDPHTIRVTGGAGEGLFRSERFVIATGTTPVLPRGVPTDHAAVIDSDGLFRLTSIPRTMIVVGGGVIGVEYACMFSTLGVAVTLVDGRRRILDFLDAEIVEALRVPHARTPGVTFRLGEVVDRVECVEGRHVVAHLASQKQLQAETLLCAAGRQGSTDTLNLEAAGLEADARGRLAVDDGFRTAVPHIYAAGDVIGFPSLASVSMEQGRVASANAFGIPTVTTPALFPYGIYTIPEMSFVGLTEEQLTRGAGALRGRHRQLPRDRPRRDHRRHHRPAQARLPPGDRRGAGRPHHRGRSDRAGPHRAGGASRSGGRSGTSSTTSSTIRPWPSATRSRRSPGSTSSSPPQIRTTATPRSASHAETFAHPSGSRRIHAVTAALDTTTHGS